MDDAAEAADLLALLAEPDRLKTLAAVALGAGTLAEVAERAGLEPRAAARALNRLVAGGLLEGEAARRYAVRTDVLQAAARRRAAGRREDAGPAGSAVVGRFLRGGRLVAIPAARGKRLAVLDHLAALFEPGRRYPEREVNEILSAVHPDYAMLRRYLVDDGFLDRADEPAPSGGHSVKVYWRTGGAVEVDKG
jgi:DNA-binding transcriptional ArsR family regulator